MVISLLLGGLGNQMFQYALGRHLSLLNNSQFKVDTSLLLDHRPGRHLVNRHFDLADFDITSPTADLGEVARYNPASLNLTGKALYRLKRLLFGEAVINESEHRYQPHILRLKGDIYLAGVWQSYKYFEDIEPEIRADFTLARALPHRGERLLQEVLDKESVAIHVRRTDYIDCRATGGFPFVGLSYYINAINCLRSNYENLSFFVFSDDIAWCKEHLLAITGDLIYVEDLFAGGTPAQYINIMSGCKHFAIANSTFSWWGAWLSLREGKIVISPRQWTNLPNFYSDELIPQNWIRL